MNRVTGKVAVISGAARGQGRSHAVTLAAEGADIIAIDSCADVETNDYPLANPDDLAETVRLVEKEGRRARGIICDVRDRGELFRAVDEAVGDFGQLDIVVANAGIAPLDATVAQAFVDVVDVNLIGAINMISAALGHLSDGGSVIAIGSFVAFASGMANRKPGSAGYTYAKKSLSHYANELSFQLAPNGIRVNVIHPTNVNTEMLHSKPVYKQFVPGVPDPTRSAAEAAFPEIQAMSIPYVEPGDVSNAVLYLASDESRFVTGMQMRVDAGALVKRRPFSL